MTEVIINKQNTNFTVSTQVDNLKVEGSFTLTTNNEIQNMYLSFSENGVNVGNANYNEYGSNTSCGYNYSDKKYKASIIAATDAVIEDIKTKPITA